MTTITTRSGKGSPLTNNEVDANFTNLNDDKVEASGDSMTGDLSFGDNNKAIFGAGSDLEIYHDGSNSYIDETATGHLFIRSNGDGIYLRSSTNEEIAHFNVNGSVKAYYDNSLKLATTSTGIDVTGTVTADSATVVTSGGKSTIAIGDQATGTYGQLLLHGGNGKYNFSLGAQYNVNNAFEITPSTAAGGTTFSTPALVVNSSGNVGIGVSAPSNPLTVLGSAGTIASFTNGADADLLIKAESSVTTLTPTTGTLVLGTSSTERMRITSTGIDVTGSVTADDMVISDGSPTLTFYETDTTNLNARFDNGGGDLYIQTVHDDGSNAKTRILIDHSEGDISFYNSAGTSQDLYWDASTLRLGIGTTSPSFGLSVESDNGSGYAALFRKSSSDPALAIQTTGGVTQIQGLNSALNATHGIAMQVSGGNVGIGTASPSSVLETSASDATTWSTSFSGVPSYTPEAQDLTISNTVINTTGSFASLFFKAGQTSSGIGINTARIAAIREGALSTSLAFSTRSSSGTLDEAIRVNSSGNVGIGTQSPNQLLTLGSSTGTATIGLDFETTNVSRGSILYNAAAGEMAFTSGYSGYGGYMTFDCNGSERMRIDSAGRVLVGTASVGYSGVDLTVGDTADSQNGIAIQTSTSGYGYVMFGDGTGFDAFRGQISYKHGDDYMMLQTAGSERMRIDSSGNVGIGTTDLTDSYKTIIEGSDQETGDLTDAGTHGATLFLRATGEDVGSGGAVAFGTTNGNKRPFAAIKGYVLDGTANSVGDLVFSTRATTSATALTERMTLTKDGRLVIGDNSPQAKLDVQSDGQYTPAGYFRNNGDTLSWARADWYNNQASGTGIVYRDSSGSFIFRNDNSSGTAMTTALVAGGTTAGNIVFNTTSSAEAARIDSSGNLLVGKTSSSDSAFEFETSQGNSSGAQIARISMGRSSSGYPVVGYNCAPRSVTNSYTKFIADYAAWIQFGASGRIDTYTTTTTATGSTSGTAGPYVNSGGTSWTSSSDRRLKDNIEGISYGLEAVKSLNPVSYVRNDRDTGATELGFIAQEVDEVVSEVVSVKDDGYYGIDYERLIPVLTKAIQEQQEIIENLKSRIEQLEGAN